MRILIDAQTLATPETGRGIGRVFQGLCRRMIPRGHMHAWWLAVPQGADLESLGAEVLRCAQVVEVPPVDLSHGYGEATDRHRAALQRICDAQRIDLCWHPNPLMLNVVLPLGLTGPREACTVYDVIPARLPETHQASWSPDARAEYGQRLDALAGDADQLIFISEAAMHDFADLDARAAERSSAAPIGIDHETFHASAALEVPPGEPYVLMVAGVDPRKNAARGIEAFALARGEGLPGDPMLRIVGAYDAEWRAELERTSEAFGVADRVELLGRVVDTRLGRLYREAAALFFPSLYEGFGLPVVEAMASGIPVVVSDRPELRECAGEHGAYCDPGDARDMAEKLAAVLRDPAAARRAACPGITRAQSYTWERTADRYLDLFEEIDSDPRDSAQPRIPAHSRTSTSPLRVAWATPWAPLRSGIADYSAAVLEHLAKRVEVEVFVESLEGADDGPGLPMRRLRDLRPERFDAVVHHLGNNSDFHRELYRSAWQHRGVIVLHDYNIHPFLNAAFLDTREEDVYRQALEQSHGDEGRRHFEAIKARAEVPDVWRYPASAAIAKRSRLTIVHSAWVAGQLEGVANVSVIPHGAAPRPVLGPEESRAARSRLGLREDGFVLGVFGFMHRQKRLPSVLAACRRLHDRGFPLTLLVVGQSADEQLDLAAAIAEHGAHDFTRTTGYVDDAAFWKHLDVCDVVLNLRHPSMGESSGTLMRALGSGKAAIVSDHAQFAELPDAVCWKVETGPGEVAELEACLAKLLAEPELRQELGRNALDYVDRVCSFELAAKRYEYALTKAAVEV
jgi:glycosyltransferase involved in cell wall biosynthesis